MTCLASGDLASSTVFPTHGYRGAAPSVPYTGDAICVLYWRRLILAMPPSGDALSWRRSILAASPVGDALLRRCLRLATPLLGDASSWRRLILRRLTLPWVFVFYLFNLWSYTLSGRRKIETKFSWTPEREKECPLYNLYFVTQFNWNKILNWPHSSCVEWDLLPKSPDRKNHSPWFWWL